MKRYKNIAVLMLLLIFTQQTTQVFGKSFSESLSKKGSTDGGNLAVLLLSSFIIGNVVAWSMGAYPHDFPKQSYSIQEMEVKNDLTSEIKENPDDADVRVELGQLYFHHNDLNKAETLLEQAVKLEPGNAEALAIYSANEAKQAGAMWDFTWGLMKLNRMSDVVEGLNKAVELEPDNFTVRLYRMNTLVGFRDKKDNFHRIFEDEEWFLKKADSSPDYFPEEVKRAFYKVLSEAYLVAVDLDDSPEQKNLHQQKAETYQLKITPIAVNL